MSREVRRVPLDWKHPTTHNEHWRIQAHNRCFGPAWARHPESRLHGRTGRFVGLVGDYAGALADWEEEGAELATRSGWHWEFSVRWHLTGYGDCSCHPGEEDVRHPVYEWSESGDAQIAVPVATEDALHAHLTAQHAAERPCASDYMPLFDPPIESLGWCLYETVSEGTPVTPVFATADELIDHLSTVGEDWDQVPLRRASAEAIVRSGSTMGSMALINGQLFDSTRDADLLDGEVTS